MGIDLGGRYVRMSQHDLHGSQIRPKFKEMSGKGMPEAVRRDPLIDSRRQSVLFDDFPEPLPGQGVSPGVEKKEA